MTVHMAKPEHEVAYQDLCALVNRHADKVTAMDLLAIAANMVGKLVAMQDQRTVTNDMAMQVIAMNITNGNRQIIEKLSKAVGGVPS